MNHYVTAFDLSQTGYANWSFLLVGLTFGTLGWISLSAYKAIQNHPSLERIFSPTRTSKQIPWWSFPVLIAVSVIFTVAGLGSYFEYKQNLNILITGQASYVEGEVYDFKPMPYSGHSLEVFSVNNISFSYSDYIKNAAFNNTASHGGPIKNGLSVKIWYYKGEILKLLIRE
jgi:hypothetical protein